MTLFTSFAGCENKAQLLIRHVWWFALPGLGRIHGLTLPSQESPPARPQRGLWRHFSGLAT